MDSLLSLALVALITFVAFLATVVVLFGLAKLSNVVRQQGLATSNLAGSFGHAGVSPGRRKWTYAAVFAGIFFIATTAFAGGSSDFLVIFSRLINR